MAGPGLHPYHQQWATPPPPPPSISVENPNRSTTDEVRTIFISGLPEDVKERELQNLLRWLAGYEASQINYKGEQPMGFALFSTPQQALGAKSAIQLSHFNYKFLISSLTPASPPSPPSSSTLPSPPPGLSVPTVDLCLPRPAAVDLIRSAARDWGFFQVLNHGIPVPVLSRDISAV